MSQLPKLSVLDLAPVLQGGDAREAFARAKELAQQVHGADCAVARDHAHLETTQDDILEQLQGAARSSPFEQALKVAL